MNKLNEMLDAITTRVSNPILFSFSISWLLTNYKIILVFIDKESYSRKIYYLENVLYSEGTNPLNRLIWIPLGAVLFYLVIIPIISIGLAGLTTLYENLQQKLKDYITGEFRLPLKQSKALKKDMAERLDKMERENEELSVARIETSRKATENVVTVLNSTLPYVFNKLKEEAIDWPENSTRKMIERTESGGTLAQHDFLKEKGLPENWIRIFENEWTNSGNMDIRTAAAVLRLNEKEALDVLLRLSSVAMVEPNWIDNEFVFRIIDQPWQRYLNGRPA